MLDLKPVRKPPPTANELGDAPPAATPKRPTRLSEQDALDVWHARWLRTPRHVIRARYDVDPRRIYEVWEEVTFIGSRQRAWAIFLESHPDLVDRVDNGRHVRRSRAGDEPGQGELFPRAGLPLRR